MTWEIIGYVIVDKQNKLLRTYKGNGFYKTKHVALGALKKHLHKFKHNHPGLPLTEYEIRPVCLP